MQNLDYEFGTVILEKMSGHTYIYILSFIYIDGAIDNKNVRRNRIGQNFGQYNGSMV